jgi:phage/plasmid-like protein (TIGR03299 family)
LIHARGAKVRGFDQVLPLYKGRVPVLRCLRAFLLFDSKYVLISGWPGGTLPSPGRRGGQAESKMAHEIDTTTGKAAIAFTGKEPWHGLGQRVQPGAPLEEWRKAGGLEWEVCRAPAFYTANERVMPAEEDVLYRSDTGAKLGVVSPAYHIVQPLEVMEFFRDYVEGLGSFEMSTVGSLRGGKRIWGLAQAKDGTFDLAGNDKVRRYLLLATSFDKTLATVVQQTSIRVVCNNTLSAAYADQETDPTIRVSHHAKFSRERVREKMQLDANWQSFVETTKKWSSRAVTWKERDEFFRKVLGLGPDSNPTPQFQKLDSIFHGAPGQQLESARDTTWGLVNAVTYLVDHEMGDSNDTRLDQAWFGQRRALKKTAVKLANLMIA